MPPKMKDVSTERAPKGDVGRLVSGLESVLRELRAGIPREWLTTELTMPQLRTVFALLQEGPARMGALAAQLGVSCSSATGLVDRLVEKSLVERWIDPADRRSVVCRLSGAGQTLAERLLQRRRSHWQRRLATLTDDEVALALDGIEALREALARRPAPELHRRPAGSGASPAGAGRRVARQQFASGHKRKMSL
jgi:DNA-binding MarR family transcriptional regulator